MHEKPNELVEPDERGDGSGLADRPDPRDSGPATTALRGQTPAPPGIPRTTAGRALLDAIATNERLSPSGLRMAEYRQAAAAIEEQAAQQERERIRKWMVDEGIHHPDSWVIAILADNSPSASAEPDGEPSE